MCIICVAVVRVGFGRALYAFVPRPPATQVQQLREVESLAGLRSRPEHKSHLVSFRAAAGLDGGRERKVFLPVYLMVTGRFVFI